MTVKMWVTLVAVFLVGCGSIQQIVKPVVSSGNEPREICVIDNPDVRESFLAAYRQALSERGFAVRTLPAGSAVASCPLTSTYTANWRWDLAMYLAYTNLKVFQSGQLGGEALYDSMSAGASTSKFINAEAKIRELTTQLFPR